MVGPARLLPSRKLLLGGRRLVIRACGRCETQMKAGNVKGRGVTRIEGVEDDRAHGSIGKEDDRGDEQAPEEEEKFELDIQREPSQI